MASFTRAVSASPVPDWQRQRAQSPSSPLIFHQPFEAPYRSLAGAKADPAPVAWAKQVVQTLTINRERLSRPDASEHNAADVAPIPEWAWTAARLPEFSSATCQDWTAAMRVMIVDQLPEFDLHPDWKSSVQHHTSRESARREILAAIANEIPRVVQSHPTPTKHE